MLLNVKSKYVRMGYIAVMEGTFRYEFTDESFLVHKYIEEACTFPVHVMCFKYVTLHYWVWGSLTCFLGLQCSCLLAANELRFDGTEQGIIMSPNSCICVHFLFLYVCISFWVVLAWQKASGPGQSYGMPRHHHVHGNSGSYSPSLYSYTFQERIYLEMYFKPCQSHLSWLLQLIYVGTLIVGRWSAICTWRYRTHAVNSTAYRKPWKSECLLIYFCFVWGSVEEHK